MEPMQLVRNLVQHHSRVIAKASGAEDARIVQLDSSTDVSSRDQAQALLLVSLAAASVEIDDDVARRRA